MTAPSTIGPDRFETGGPLSERTRVVPVSLVDNNPFNARCVYDDEVIAQRAREIRADGQLVPAMAVPSSVVPHRFVLIDGHYRKRAVIAAGLKTMLLDVRDPVTDLELYRLSYALNAHRTAHTVLDNALAWSRLLTSGTVPSQSALQAVIGKSHSTISKTLQLLDLPTQVLAIVRSAPSRFTLKLGYALVLICRAGGAPRAARLAERALTQHLAQAEVDQTLRWAQMGKHARKRREESRRYDIDASHCVGSIKSWDSGKVLVDLSFADQARKALFVEQLRGLIVLPIGTSAACVDTRQQDAP